MKRIACLALVLVTGCGAAEGMHARSAEPSTPSGAAGYPPAAMSMPAAPMASTASVETSAVAAPSSTPIAPDSSPKRLPQSGQLTAGVWDDNLNFEFYKPYAAKFSENSQDLQMFSTPEVESAMKSALQQLTPKTDLDVQLVLDTTGSMGDELSYLQSEFDSIAKQVQTKFPNVTPHWSLIVYRDHGDEYVTRDFGFTTDTNRFRENLKAQSAAGGGDTPEAVVEGLSKGLAQGWRTTSSTAKLVFWVADAPAHPGEGSKLANVIRDAQKKGVHIYPVASSDADDTAEYQMRAAAQMTGGRYVFLTSDSGIGNSHAEPHIPCYSVTKLDQAIVRMIAVEMAGKRVEADEKQIVRQVGQPGKDGKCKLPSGMLVASY